MEIENKSKKNKEKREKRRKQTAEDFTPPSLINEMLDKFEEFNKDFFKDPTKTVCDPACGNGNMLIEVAKRKLKNGSTPLQVSETLFGVDIMQDNIAEVRRRLIKLFDEHMSENGKSFQQTLLLSPSNKKHQCCLQILANLFCNILVTKTTKPDGSPGRYPNGALDYDFSFPRDYNTEHKQVIQWAEAIKKHGLDHLENQDVCPDEEIRDADTADLEKSTTPNLWNSL